jgi:hypothetical protein
VKLDRKKAELIERALDTLYQHADPCNEAETALYCQAVSIVREIPDGRRVRSDFNSTRVTTPQQELIR